MKKNTLEVINSRINETGEQITEPEDRVLEITATEQNKGKKNNERNGDTLRQHWDNVKRKSIHILGVLQEEDKEKEPGKCSKIL